jgi:hypothetical protein
MVDVIVNDGRDFFENVAVDESYTETLNTMAVGDGVESPSLTDSSLTNNLYESSGGNVTVSKESAVGLARFTITITGGTEVPANSEITEIAIKASDGTLVYYEVRSSPIDIDSGESKTIQVSLNLNDADIETDTAMVDAGLDHIINLAIGNETNKVSKIAVGSSTNDVSQTDSTMFDEKHRASNNESYVILAETTNVGEVDARITVSAGSDANDQVAANTDISEFGIFTDNDVLVLHETRDSIVTLENNDSKTFNIPFDIIQ